MELLDTTRHILPLESKRADPIPCSMHTMGPSLLRYLELKVHHLVQEGHWKSVHVVGAYDRASVVSRLEKNDKMFNWQRPTAAVVGDDLVIKCFPGADYVHHYALILSTYLEMVGRYEGQVTFELPDRGTCEAAMKTLKVDPREADLVVVGWGVDRMAGAKGWTFGNGYAWKHSRFDRHSVLFIGFLHSIWGDVAGRVVSRLARLGARQVLYIGKVGTLDASIRPNSCLATGNESLVQGRTVRWLDFFDVTSHSNPVVRKGRHVTSPSTLLETQLWLSEHHEYQFVDPEIGPMGEAASFEGIPFGYLHVVSNNLSRPYGVDLSNERRHDVLRDRSRLLAMAKDVIAQRLQLRDAL